MFTHCILCSTGLGSNDLVERFPVGRRLAFDPERGRLWVICAACGGWNLAPLEDRWEPVEQCERMFRGTRLRTSTANIGLATHKSGVELVRIGRPLRPEFAAWRYGPRFARRRRRALIAGALGMGAIAGVGIGAAVALGVSAGFWGMADWAWRSIDGRRPVLRLHENGTIVRRKHLKEIVWRPTVGDRNWQLEVNDSALTGNEGMHLAAMALNILNRKAGRAVELQSAVEWIDTCGSPFTNADPDEAPDLRKERMTRRVELEKRLDRGFPLMNIPRPLWELPPYQRLAFELAAHESQERLFLTTHLWLLERHWREAEEIAAIADRLLVPESVTAALRRLRGDKTPVS